MRALVTRPTEDAAPLAAALKSRGIEPVVVPLMSIRPTGTVPRLEGMAALLFTSANGVRAFAAASTRRDLPCYAVGSATAQALKEAGFTQIETASGTVEALAALAATRLDPKAGALLHVAGSDVAGDLAGDLTAKGYTVERAVLYEAVPIDTLPDSLIGDLDKERIDFVLLFSPRTARLFAERVRAARLAPKMRRLTALCLSRAVADAADLPFAAKRVPLRPEQSALLDLLDRPTVPPAPPPAAPAHSAMIGALSGLLAAALVAVIAIFTAPAWLPLAPRQDPALTQRLDSLSRDLAALRAAPAPAAPDVKPLTDRLQSLEQALGTLQTRLGEAGNADRRIGELAQQVTALQQQLAELARTQQSEAERSAAEATKRAGMALAASQLAQALSAGQPFAPSLASALSLSGDGPLKTQLAALQPAAERGIPTVDALARRFPAVARDATVAAAKESAGGGWMGELRGLVARLVTIRPTDPARGGDDTDNHLARAQAYLESRDLGQAVGEIKALPPTATEAASGWLVDARQRLAADAAVAALQAQAATGLAAGAR